VAVVKGAGVLVVVVLVVVIKGAGVLVVVVRVAVVKGAGVLVIVVLVVVIKGAGVLVVVVLVVVVRVAVVKGAGVRNFRFWGIVMMVINTTNSSSPNNTQSVSFAIGTFILGIVFLLGVPGNLFIIWSILARARKQSVTTLIILNLACADGAIMCLTVFFIVYLAKQSWVFGRFMCKLLFYLCNTNMYASIMLITLMSVHRLLTVLRPQGAHFFKRRRNMLSILTMLWLLVFILAIPALIFRDENKENANQTLCSHRHPDPRYEVFHMSMETVLGFLLPYGIIFSSYVCILHRLRQTPFKRRVRSEKLILTIIITFAAFWLPYHIINIVQVVSACAPEDSDLRKRLSSISSSSRAATSSLAFISSCANPVLYALAGRSYIRTDGLSFMARLFEGTALEIISGTLRIHRKSTAIIEGLRYVLASAILGGGSGFVGRELTKLLKVQGHEVTIISRQPGLGRVTWTEVESAGLPECDAVVNLAGENVLYPLRWWSESFRSAVFNSRINTTRTLTHSITSSQTPPRSWILVTGVGCYKANVETLYTEDTEWTTFDLWSQLLKEWEEAGQLPENTAKNTGQVVIRSGVVLGRGGGAVKQMLPPFWLGLGGTLGSGDQPFPWIHVSDLTGIIAHSLDPTRVPASSQPRVFNGVAPSLDTNRQFTRELARLLKRPTLLPVPEPVLRAVLGRERAALLTQGPRVAPKRTLESGYRFQYPDLTSALRQILAR
ncbi:hypothetical protein QTP70_035032, partial [Hemibagrus guttatus]